MVWTCDDAIVLSAFEAPRRTARNLYLKLNAIVLAGTNGTSRQSSCRFDELLYILTAIETKLQDMRQHTIWYGSTSENRGRVYGSRSTITTQIDCLRIFMRERGVFEQTRTANRSIIQCLNSLVLLLSTMY
jgi:hypothetical protein